MAAKHIVVSPLLKILLGRQINIRLVPKSAHHAALSEADTQGHRKGIGLRAMALATTSSSSDMLASPPTTMVNDPVAAGTVNCMESRFPT